MKKSYAQRAEESRFYKALLDEKTRKEMMLHAENALDLILTGVGTQHAWMLVCTLINMAYTCDKMYFASCGPEIKAAMRAHKNCGARFISHNRYGYSGVELEDIRNVFAIYEQQLSLVTRGEYNNVVGAFNKALTDFNNNPQLLRVTDAD